MDGPGEGNRANQFPLRRPGVEGAPVRKSRLVVVFGPGFSRWAFYSPHGERVERVAGLMRCGTMRVLWGALH